jgi:hypothetical protein
VLKRTIIILLLTIPLLASAQKAKPKNDSSYDDRPLHFGFSLGVNAMDFKIKPAGPILNPDGLFPEVATLNPGVNIQVVINYRPANFVDFRFLPGVSLGQRTINFYKNGVLYSGDQKLESSFLEFPLLLKFKGARLNNSRPYVITGLNFKYDLAGKREYDDATNIFLRLHRFDPYYTVGAGVDFYLPEFKLSIEVKMENGMRDVLVHTPAPMHPEYCNAISSMRSQMWVLAFHFE